MTRFPASPLVLLAGLLLSCAALAQDAAIETLESLPYKAARSNYERERCRLDLFLPEGKEKFPTLVWFHGGGLTGGGKDDGTTREIARMLAGKGIAAAIPNYRLSPQETFPAYVEDAAAAFAWVRANIAKHGGDPDKVFIGGHSAGGYLASMVAMDPRFLEKHRLDPSAIAGALPMSGQMMTHFTVRKERGIDENTILADDAAPIRFTRKDTPPMLILMGDRDWPARLEENAYFVAVQRAAENPRVSMTVVENRDHGSIASETPKPGDPAGAAIVNFIETISGEAGE